MAITDDLGVSTSACSTITDALLCFAVYKYKVLIIVQKHLAFLKFASSLTQGSLSIYNY
jgi:hypothetical protein